MSRFSAESCAQTHQPTTIFPSASCDVGEAMSPFYRLSSPSSFLFLFTPPYVICHEASAPRGFSDEHAVERDYMPCASAEARKRHCTPRYAWRTGEQREQAYAVTPEDDDGLNATPRHQSTSRPPSASLPHSATAHGNHRQYQF